MPRLDIKTTTTDRFNPERAFNLTKDTEYTAKLKEILIANQIRSGAGTDIFKASGGGFVVRTSKSESSVAAGVFTNGTQVVNEVKIQSLGTGKLDGATPTSGKTLLAFVERAVYAGTDGDATYLLPGGANIDESNFQVIGSNFSVIDVSTNAASVDTLFNHLYIRNISNGNTALYFDVYVRYVMTTGTPSQT